MHPSPVFAWNDREEMLAFVRARGFAHIFTSSDEGPVVAHAPLLVTSGGSIQFHLARSNRATAAMAGSRLLVSIADLDAYQSANWYVSENQVPTWHYQAVEIEGQARELEPHELVAHLDGLSANFEALYQPEAPWTRAKMDSCRFEAFTRAISGFEVHPEAIRGTRKYNQHKKRGDIDASIRGPAEGGREDVAAQIELHWPGK